jgi:hypothetical protein
LQYSSLAAIANRVGQFILQYCSLAAIGNRADFTNCDEYNVVEYDTLKSVQQ